MNPKAIRNRIFPLHRCIGLAVGLVAIASPPGWTDELTGEETRSNRLMIQADNLHLSEIEQSATTVEDWSAQIEASLVQIADVRVEKTRRVSAAVAQNQSFGCIFSYLAGKPKKSTDVHKLENEWLRMHKSKLSELCFGIAMVSNPSVHSLLMKIVMKGLGKQVLGCECKARSGGLSR